MLKFARVTLPAFKYSRPSRNVYFSSNAAERNLCLDGLTDFVAAPDMLLRLYFSTKLPCSIQEILKARCLKHELGDRGRVLVCVREKGESTTASRTDSSQRISLSGK